MLITKEQSLQYLNHTLTVGYGSTSQIELIFFSNFLEWRINKSFKVDELLAAYRRTHTANFERIKDDMRHFLIKQFQIEPQTAFGGKVFKYE